MRSVESIYQELKAYYESYNAQVDEQRLRQMAWMKRDRMMFENVNLSQSISGGVSAGGSSFIKRSDQIQSPLTTPFTIGPNQSFVIEGDLVLDAQLTILPGGVLTVVGSITDNVAIINDGVINLL